MEEAVRLAELETSGELRVHIENRCPGAALDRAADVFARLGMHRTAERNGVLVYVALDDHKLAIIGDAGINAKVPPGFWDGIRDRMVERCRRGRVTEGICEAVVAAGKALREYFPRRTDDRNELPDEISFN